MDPFDLVTVGELLYVLRASWGTTLERTGTLSCHVSGSEANVAIGLANLGMRVTLLSKVPANFMGRAATGVLRSFGVDTEGVVEADGGRMGLLFQEFGVGARPGENTYDRAGSAFTHLGEDEIDWSRFRDAKRFLGGGITAALGPGPRRLLTRAMHEAADAGMQILFDVNYRSKLWSPDEARRTMEPMLPEVDLLFVKHTDAQVVFGCEDNPEKVCTQLRDRFGINAVIVTAGAEGAFGDDGTPCHVPPIRTDILSRFGLGDAFVVGVVYGLTRNDLPAALRIGHAVAALKSTYTHESYSLLGMQHVERMLKAARDADDVPPDVVR